MLNKYCDEIFWNFASAFNLPHFAHNYHLTGDFIDAVGAYYRCNGFERARRIIHFAEQIYQVAT
jgi:hypothetical protein